MRGFFVAAAFTVLIDGVAAAKTLPLKLCLTGTLPKVFPNYGEAFWNGAEMALAESGAAKEAFILERFYYDQNPLAPRDAMSDMLKAGCHAALGFDFTNDLMVVREKAESEGLLILSMYGAMNPSLDTSGVIRSYQVPPVILVERLLAFVEGPLKRRFKKVLLVTTVDWDELKDFRDAAVERLKMSKTEYLLVNQVEASFRVADVEAELKRQKEPFDGILLFVRSRPAAEVADLVWKTYAKGAAPLLLGTKFFGTSTLPAFTNMLKYKEVTTYFTHQATNEDPDPAYQTFVKRYEKAYAKPPMGLAALVYDAVSLVAKASFDLRFEPGASDAKMRKALVDSVRSIDHHGITGVKVKKGLEFSYHKTFVIKTDAGGYHLVE